MHPSAILYPLQSFIGLFHCLNSLDQETLRALVLLGWASIVFESQIRGDSPNQNLYPLPALALSEFHRCKPNRCGAWLGRTNQLFGSSRIGISAE